MAMDSTIVWVAEQGLQQEARSAQNSQSLRLGCIPLSARESCLV